MKGAVETHKGWLEFPQGRKYYFKSKWEMNIAKYLMFLERNGDIKFWEYETERFMFEKIKRGTNSYLPDFKVTGTTGKVVYYEVKGWMDRVSATKLKRMKKYYPQIEVVVVDKKRYAEIMRFGKLFGAI